MAPGKTAPRLLQDLLTYDPRREDRAGRNLLTSAPPEFREGQTGKPAVPRGNCRHALVRKDEQCLLPVDGNDDGLAHKVASYCTQCYWHIDVIVNFKDRGSGSGSRLCGRQNADYPLHHYVYDGENTDGNTALQRSLRSFNFHCTAGPCSTTVRIDFRPPRFSENDRDLLMNKAKLRRRYEQAVEMIGDREGETMARCVDGPDFLDTFLRDSLNPVPGKSRIPLMNRKFAKTFWRDCDSILTRLGFQYMREESEGEDSVFNEVWNLPKPEAQQDPFQTTLRSTIQDARYELNSMILAFSENERQNVRHLPMYPVPSQGDIERVLACHDYDKLTGRTRSTSSTEEDHPYYAGLGAVGDFADPLLQFAYYRQSEVDRDNAPYYLECFQGIAAGRNSESLGTEAAMIRSLGTPTRSEIEAAYRALGIEPAHGVGLTDNFLIDQARSRFPDISPSQREALRGHLKVIGFARDSEALKREANESIDTYEDAVRWLDLDPSQPDDFVRTMFAIKTQDNPACIEQARKAVSLIAGHRNSDRLRQFLHEGTMTEPEMDLGEAYALFEISSMSDRQNVDLSVLQSSMLVAPSNDIAKLEKAFSLIQDDQAKNYSNKVDEPKIPGSRINDFPLETWPVGCRNNGNTCYLNSVLQFLFTITPLRELVLNFESYEQDPSPEALKNKKVGRAVVTPQRVVTAQKFVRELQSLFQLMISAPTDNVLPSKYLAELALCKTDSPETGPKAPDAESEAKNVITNGQDSASLKEGDAATLPTDTVMGGADETANGEAEMKDAEQAVDGTSDPSDKPSPPTRPPPIPPRPKAPEEQKSKDDHIAESARQQDAAEVMGNIMDLISCAIRPDGLMTDGEQEDLIKDLFFSNVAVVRDTVDKKEKTHELRNHHLISAGGRDRHLYAALDDDFGLSDLEGGDTKYEYIATAAPIQIVNVRRLQFNREKKQQVRDTAQLSLDDVLYLDRYLEATRTLPGDALLQLRQAQWAKRQKLQQLAARRQELQATSAGELDLASAVEETALFAETLIQNMEQHAFDALPSPPPSDLPATLHATASQLKAELERINTAMTTLEADMDSVFNSYHDHGYRLHAIFVHRGGTGSGHYLIYIKDFQSGVWREYNDESVRPYPEDDVFKIGPGALAAGSTGIVFVREDKVDVLTSAVCRRPQQQVDQAGSAADVQEADFVMADSPALEEGAYAAMEVIDGIERA